MKLRPIENEDAAIARLQRDGWSPLPISLACHDGDRPSLADAIKDGLRLLAKRGAELQRRYEASCSHQWATTEHYYEGTETLEDACRGLAQRLGLHLYIQGDPRGVALYVSPSPISPNSYNSDAVAIYPKGR